MPVALADRPRPAADARRGHGDARALRRARREELASARHAVAGVGVPGRGRRLGSVDRDREGVGRRVLGDPAEGRHGERGGHAVREVVVDEALDVRGPRRAVVVDVLEEPVLARVPRVSELPVVPAGVVAAPAAGGRVEEPQVGPAVLRPRADAVDERADGVGRGLAPEGHCQRSHGTGAGTGTGPGTANGNGDGLGSRASREQGRSPQGASASAISVSARTCRGAGTERASWRRPSLPARSSPIRCSRAPGAGASRRSFHAT